MGTWLQTGRGIPLMILRRVLEKTGLSKDDIDLFEVRTAHSRPNRADLLAKINEAFASM